ncbi:MAG: DEAD/DEAH box helicase [Magnetococcus sp. DMHC-6]
MELTELPIPAPVMAGIKDCGFTTCTLIQELTLPLTLAGRDVAGQAQTGTGKTAAYLIALFSRLLQHSGEEARRPSSPGVRSRPRALVIAPTRELVVQIERDALILGGHTGLKMMAVYGGVAYEEQKNILAEGSVDVLIGTPGRLIDYLKQKVYGCSQVQTLVIDEADRMFDMGFITDLRFMLRRLPPHDQRLSMLFSATLSYRAQELSYEYMNDPEVISTPMTVRTADLVTQSLYHVEGSVKIRLLVGLLRRDLAEKTTGAQRVMIFVNTKRMGERLMEWLQLNGIDCGYLSGDVPQSKRLKVLVRFQAGEIPVLIATDVAGRGLHIDDVTLVINFDLSENPEDYVHRIGRTARAGAKGDAISLVDEEGAYNLEAIEAFLGSKIPVAWVDDALLVQLKKPPHRAYSSDDKNKRRSSSGQSASRPSVRRGGERPSAGRSVETVDVVKENSQPLSSPKTSSSVTKKMVTASSEEIKSGEAELKKRKRRRTRRRKPLPGSAGEGNVSTNKTLEIKQEVPL